MDNYNYPMGSDTEDAPWNKDSNPEKEIEVTVSVTLSKTVKISVDDYVVEENADKDGKYLDYDFSNCDLHKAVEDQVYLPQNLAIVTERLFDQDLDLKAAGMPMYLKDAVEDCKDWNLDDFEVVIN